MRRQIKKEIVQLKDTGKSMLQKEINTIEKVRTSITEIATSRESMSRLNTQMTTTRCQRCQDQKETRNHQN